ncbi:MAG: F-box protein [Chlamydiia bacterium]|nr:F-box protein [Chlamydiia bacterium]
MISPIHWLPSEILCHTFNYLPDSTLVSIIPLVCREWHKITSNENFWRLFAHQRGLIQEDFSWKNTARRLIKINDSFHRLNPRTCSIPSSCKWHQVTQTKTYTAIITHCSYHTYNTKKIKPITNLSSPRYENYMSLTPYENKVACGTNRGTVRLFDAKSTISGGINYKKKRCIDPILWDRTNLFACSYTNYFDQWDIETEQKIQILNDEKPYIIKKIISYSSEILITIKGRQFLTLWDVRTPTPLFQIRSTRDVKDLTSIFEQNRFYTITDQQTKQENNTTIDFWDLRKLTGPIQMINSIQLKKDLHPLAFGASLNYLFVGTSEKGLLIFNAKEGDPVKAKISTPLQINSMHVFHTTIVATSDAQKLLIILNL